MELDELFGVKNENGDGGTTEGGTAGDAAEAKQEEKQGEQIDLQQKVAELQAALTKAQQERSELAKALDSLTGGNREGGGGAAQPAQTNVTTQPQLDPTLAAQALVSFKLRDYVSKNPDIEPYINEVVEILNNGVPDPNVRITDSAIDAAVTFVRGKHIDDIIKNREKKVVSPTVQDRMPGAPLTQPQERSGLDVNLNDVQKTTLLSWFDGDVEAVKKGLVGGKNEQSR